MKTTIRFLKPFAAWVTDLTDRFKHDPDVRTTTLVILLQIGLALLSLMVFSWTLQYAQKDTIGSIAEHVHEVVTHETTSTSSLPVSIEQVRNRAYLLVALGIIFLNGLFGYLIAFFALRPTRQSLSYQKRFIGNIAHEIRTPLSIIKTSTEVALFDPSLSADMRKMLDQTLEELNRMSETINNLLSFGSNSSKTMQFVPVDLSSVTRTAIDRLQELAKSRGIALVGEIRENCTILGNATGLDQVVTNLTKNAINYTPADKDGKVVVSVKRLPGGDIALTIVDTGIGIEEKDLFHVFEPFYRADSSRARGVGTGSSGLGLAIVNEIVRLHHGALSLRSTVGKGTSVRVVFPPARRKQRALFTSQVDA